MNIVGKIIEKIYLSLDDNLAYFDSVTHCRTRLYYDTVVKKRYQQYECYVVFVDIDNLKELNDTNGHSYGTQIIKNVGNQLLKIPYVFDVCRIGGDEFILICGQKFKLSSLKKIRNISYGCYYKEQYEDVSSAVSKADKAMYLMKQNKKQNRGKGEKQ